MSKLSFFRDTPGEKLCVREEMGAVHFFIGGRECDDQKRRWTGCFTLTTEEEEEMYRLLAARRRLREEELGRILLREGTEGNAYRMETVQDYLRFFQQIRNKGYGDHVVCFKLTDGNHVMAQGVAKPEVDNGTDFYVIEVS